MKLLVALILAAWCPSARPADELDAPVDLPARIDRAASDGFSVEELRALSAECLERADRAASRSAFWGEIRPLARLCAEGPRARGPRRAESCDGAAGRA